MKAAFYYSKSMVKLQVHQHRFNSLTIDGLDFTESVTFEDDEEIKPFSVWKDNVLVMVVENVDVASYGGFHSLTYGSGPLKGRITINGKIQ